MELSLISCNIRFDNPKDGANSWPHRREILADILLKHDPDLIATQEGRFEQLKDFQNLLQLEIVDQHRSWIRERMYPSFFVKKEVFEIIKSEDLWLSETPEVAGSKSFDSAFPRLLTWMKVQPKKSKEALLFVNTHLDHVKKETRVEQVKVLAQEIKRVWDGRSLLIIMGDFNDGPESEVRSILKKEFPGIVDPWKKFHSTEETSHHAFLGEFQNGSRIDWILVNGEVKIEDYFMDKSTSNGKYPTDHFPIVCKLSFNSNL
jgi:endonuclease/exonuclease/phosphatase family metal-dependent hydrolase